MKVRLFEPEDAAALAALFARSVEGLGPRHYSPAQVAVWRARAPTAEAMLQRSSDGRSLWVVVANDDTPLAFGDLEADGHIDVLYCAPEAAGTGATALLYDQIERHARDRGIGRLYSEASEAAKRFFAKRGFVVTARRDFELGGVPIHNYAMEKWLS